MPSAATLPGPALASCAKAFGRGRSVCALLLLLTMLGSASAQGQDVKLWCLDNQNAWRQTLLQLRELNVATDEEVRTLSCSSMWAKFKDKIEALVHPAPRAGAELLDAQPDDGLSDAQREAQAQARQDEAARARNKERAALWTRRVDPMSAYTVAVQNMRRECNNAERYTDRCVWYAGEVLAGARRAQEFNASLSKAFAELRIDTPDTLDAQVIQDGARLQSAVARQARLGGAALAASTPAPPPSRAAPKPDAPDPPAVPSPPASPRAAPPAGAPVPEPAAAATAPAPAPAPALAAPADDDTPARPEPRSSIDTVVIGSRSEPRSSIDTVIIGSRSAPCVSIALPARPDGSVPTLDCVMLDANGRPIRAAAPSDAEDRARTGPAPTAPVRTHGSGTGPDTDNASGEGATNDTPVLRRRGAGGSFSQTLQAQVDQADQREAGRSQREAQDWRQAIASDQAARARAAAQAERERQAQLEAERKAAREEAAARELRREIREALNEGLSVLKTYVDTRNGRGPRAEAGATGDMAGTTLDLSDYMRPSKTGRPAYLRDGFSRDEDTPARAWKQLSPKQCLDTPFVETPGCGFQGASPAMEVMCAMIELESGELKANFYGSVCPSLPRAQELAQEGVRTYENGMKWLKRALAGKSDATPRPLSRSCRDGAPWLPENTCQ